MRICFLESMSIRMPWQECHSSFKKGSYKSRSGIEARFQPPALNDEPSSTSTGAAQFCDGCCWAAVRAASTWKYIGRYKGDPRTRDAAYHQGTVWPWLMGPYISAYSKTFGKNAGREFATEWLKNFQIHMGQA